jgi:hypothetical protein
VIQTAYLSNALQELKTLSTCYYTEILVASRRAISAEKSEHVYERPRMLTQLPFSSLVLIYFM